MNTGLTPSEKFVTELCQRAFLKLWTHPNPIGKNGKELCDCLIVCGPHIIIISVKEIQYKDTGDKVGWERWHRAAIDASVKQIWGAERWLARADQLIRKDGRLVSLPPKEERKIHRISVSLGAAGQAPLRWGDLGHGFVHVCDEFSLGAMFGHFDTITDFISYLVAVESLLTKGVTPIFAGGGSEDLLAVYVRYGEDFGLPKDVDPAMAMLIVEDGVWNALVASQEYKELVDDRKTSYVWDNLIENFANDLLTDGMFDMYSKAITRSEEALIAMAMQPRNYRAPLAESFVGLLESKPTEAGKLAARAAVGANNTAFVFLTGKHGDREIRSQELMMRCHVVRGRLPLTTVIGIATDKPGECQGHSSDILYLFMPEWSAENESMAQRIVRDLGYFKNTVWNKKAGA